MRIGQYNPRITADLIVDESSHAAAANESTTVGFYDGHDNRLSDFVRILLKQNRRAILMVKALAKRYALKMATRYGKEQP
jgi:hypothetical protein